MNENQWEIRSTPSGAVELFLFDDVAYDDAMNAMVDNYPGWVEIDWWGTADYEVMVFVPADDESKFVSEPCS